MAPWHVLLAWELHRIQHYFTTPSIFLLGVKVFPLLELDGREGRGMGPV